MGPKDGGTCDERKAPERPCVVLGDFEDTRLCEKRAAPGRGKSLAESLFFKRTRPGAWRVGRAQECKREDLREKERILIAILLLYMMNPCYFASKKLSDTLSVKV